MAYNRAHGTVIMERLANWYINVRDFPMDSAQLTNLAKGLSKPFRRTWTYKDQTVTDLVAHLWQQSDT